jgi:TonB family protein
VGKVFLGMLMGFGLLIVGIIFIGVLVSHPGSRGTDETNATTAAQTISVSAPKLWADYQANEVAADNVYKGRELIVEGQVASINKDVVDDAYVLLSTYNEFESVHAELNSQYEPQAASLQIGQIITVRCEGGGMILASPFLKDCSIQPHAPPMQSNPEPAPQPQPQFQQAPQSFVQDANTSSNQADNSNMASDSVTPPILVFQDPAEYTLEARSNKLQGTVQLILQVDEDGNPQNVTVVRSLGMGLDESAVEAVQHYKFKPAVDERTGKAVSAQMSINVSFHLD